MAPHTIKMRWKGLVCNKAFWEKDGRSSAWSKQGLRRSGEETGSVLIFTRSWGLSEGSCVWQGCAWSEFLPGPKVTRAFWLPCSDGSREKERGGRFVSSQTSETRSGSLSQHVPSQGHCGPSFQIPDKFLFHVYLSSFKQKCGWFLSSLPFCQNIFFPEVVCMWYTY